MIANLNIKSVLIFFTITQSGFAYDSVVQHYEERRAAYDRKENVDIHTPAINHTLSREDLIDPNLHDGEKKKKVMQAVMASVIIHGRDHGLTARLPQPVRNTVLEDHFKILSLTEKISFSIVDQTKCRYDPEDFRLLKEYSGIEETAFLDWFSEVCAEHQTQDLSLIFKEAEARRKGLEDTLSELTNKLNNIGRLEGQINRDTLANAPHHYDSSISDWANELWAAFTVLNPINISSAEKVEEKIIAKAKKAGRDGLITDRYNHLKGAGFGVAQNYLQQIVDWGIETGIIDGGYSVFIYALIPAEGSRNSAMYNAFLFPAISVIQNLYLTKIKEIEREIQNNSHRAALSAHATAASTEILPDNQAPLPVRADSVAAAKRPISPDRALDEISLFNSENGEIAKQEYTNLLTPFTLAVTEQEIENALMVLPRLNDRQQNLGFNGWGLGSADASGFHRSAQNWSDQQYNRYFEQGILREIVFILTGVREGQHGTVKDHFTEAQIRIMLSLGKEMKITPHAGTSQLWRERLLGSVLKSISQKHAIHTKDPSGREQSLSFYSIAEAETPRGYEKYKFNPAKEGDNGSLYWLTYCVEHVMIETMRAIKTDPAILRLAKQFHKQKLIEERLYAAQYARMEGKNTDGRQSIVGEAFTREHSLAEIVNRALFKLIEAKVKHALEMYIFPLSPAFARDESGFPATDAPPVVDAAEMQAYTPDFMKNPALKKILEAEYISLA